MEDAKQLQKSNLEKEDSQIHIYPRNVPEIERDLWSKPYQNMKSK